MGQVLRCEMPEKVKWVDREFDFTFPLEDYQKFLDRLKNNPAKLSNLVTSQPKEVLVRRVGESWSIQENAGHLVTVELLFIKRVDDYLNGASVLTEPTKPIITTRISVLF
jgi:hypothetical protein